jgi:hypothetical protein
VLVTAFGRQTRQAFLLAVVAAVVTLNLVFTQRPVWVDVLGTLVVWLGVIWLRRHNAARVPVPQAATTVA